MQGDNKMDEKDLLSQADEIQRIVTEEDGETLKEDVGLKEKEFIRQVGSNIKEFLH